jgi:hypothetical protein
MAQPALISSPRTRLVVVGNCQAETLADALQSDAALNRRFATKYHFARLQEPFQAAAREDLAQADVILAQDIHDWTLYPLREAIRPDTEIRPFPLLNLASPWPFDHHNGAQDRTAHEAEWPNLTFQYFDGLLGRLRQDIPDPEARFAAYAALDVPGVLNHRRLHQFEARRLQALDVKYPWGLGQHILDNFRQKRLFHTTTHPTRDLFCLLLEQLVTPLGHRRAIDRANPKLDQLGDLQVPVHPLVAAALGLAWATPATRYRFKTEDVTWDQYIRRYIAHYG